MKGWEEYRTKEIYDRKDSRMKGWEEYRTETIYEREDKEWKGCIRGKYRTEKNKKGKDEGLKEYRILRIWDGKHIGRREFRTERI